MSNNFFVNQTNPEIFYAVPRPGGIANIRSEDKPPKRLKTGSFSVSKFQGESRSRTGSKANAASTPRTSKTKTRATRSRTSGSKISAVGTSRTSTSSSRKSLLTVSTRYDEPVDLDIDSCPRQYKVKQIIAATPWSVEFDEYLEPTEDSKRIPDPFQDAVDMLAMTISVIMLLSKGYNTIGDSHFKWVLSYLKCIKDEFGKTPPNVQGILNHINQVTGGKIVSFLEEEEVEPEELSGERGVKISPGPPTVAPVEPEPEPEPEPDAEEG